MSTTVKELSSAINKSHFKLQSCVQEIIEELELKGFEVTDIQVPIEEFNTVNGDKSYLTGRVNIDGKLI